MKKLTLALLLICMLLTAALAEEAVFPSQASGLSPLAGVLSEPPYSLDAERLAAEHGWSGFIEAIRFPCRLFVDQGGKQLCLSPEQDFAFKKRSISVSAQDLFACEFTYSAKAGCYVASDVTVDGGAQGASAFEFVAAHWDEAVFEYSAQTDKEDGPSLTMTGSPATGALSSLRIEDKTGGISFCCQWNDANAQDGAALAFTLNVPVTIDGQKYTASVTASYGPDGALLERDGSVFAASFQSKTVRIQVNLDAQGRPTYAASSASGAVYNTDGALSVLAFWNDGAKAWKTAGTPTKTTLPSMDDVAAALAVRVE